MLWYQGHFSGCDVWDTLLTEFRDLVLRFLVWCVRRANGTGFTG